MLDTAAVIGRSFTFALLEASTKIDADPLLDSLEESEAAGLGFIKPGKPRGPFPVFP